MLLVDVLQFLSAPFIYALIATLSWHYITFVPLNKKKSLIKSATGQIVNPNTVLFRLCDTLSTQTSLFLSFLITLNMSNIAPFDPRQVLHAMFGVSYTASDDELKDAYDHKDMLIHSNNFAMFLGAEGARQLLQTDREKFWWGTGWFYTFQTLLGHSLFVQDGEEHRRNRRLMTPAFSGDALRSYLPVMVELVQRHLSHWQKRFSDNKGILNAQRALKSMTLELALELLVGCELQRDLDTLSLAFTDLTAGFFCIPIYLPGTTWYKALRGRQIICDFIDKIVQNRLALMAEQYTPERVDPLWLLMTATDEQGNKLTPKELQSQAMLLLFAGHDTTTSVLTFALVFLATHPDWLNRLRKEQEQVLGPLANESDAPCPSLEDFTKMSLLEAFLLETERLMPPAPTGMRGCVVHDLVYPLKFNKHKKEAKIAYNTRTIYYIPSANRDPRVFPHPHDFHPERWLEVSQIPKDDEALLADHASLNAQQTNKRTPYHFLTFGGGPRICLGMAFAQLEMKIVLSILIRKVQFEIVQIDALKLQLAPVLSVLGGLPIRFQFHPQGVPMKETE